MKKILAMVRNCFLLGIILVTFEPKSTLMSELTITASDEQFYNSKPAPILTLTYALMSSPTHTLSAMTTTPLPQASTVTQGSTPKLVLTPSTQIFELMVNTTDDVDDGVCDSIHCSLREAINAANERAGPDTITFDSIVFPLSEAGVIKPTSMLPRIIDGETKIDATGANVTIDGSNLTLLGIDKECFAIYNSSGNFLKGIRIQNFPGVGVFINAQNGGKSNNNTLINLTIVGNGYGLPPFKGRMDAFVATASGSGSRACDNRVINCIIENNADDGIALNARDGAECDYNVFIGNLVRYNDEMGIEIDAEGSGSSACFNTVANNMIEGHQFYAELEILAAAGGRADNNIVHSNIIRKGLGPGICIHAWKSGSSTTRNIIINNTIEHHAEDGIVVMSYAGLADDNVIKCNMVQRNNGVGIYIDTYDNFLYYNNLIDNNTQARDYGTNYWDKEGKGNSWSDYQGSDNNNDGIGDTPYYIPPNGIDHYPVIIESEPPDEDVPKTPSNLWAIEISSDHINLTWKDNSDNEEGFKIERRRGEKGEWIQIQVTQADVENFIEKELEKNIYYYYRIQAFNSNGHSTYSNLAESKIITSQYFHILSIWAEVGGTTDPASKIYIYDHGTDVVITAKPDIYYRFSHWSGDVSGAANLITITMNSNKSVAANFIRIHYPPLNFTGKKVLNRSLSQAEYINILNWQANPKNSDITISKYKIFQLHNGERSLVAELDSNTFKYWHRNVQKETAYRYEIVVINSDGREGYPARIVVE